MTTAYLAVMFSLYILFPGFGGYGKITAAKWVFYTVLTGAYIVVVLVSRAYLAASGAERLPIGKELFKRLDPVYYLAAGYLLFTLISALLSPYKAVAFFGSGRREGFVTILLYVLGFLAVSRYVRPKGWLLGLFAAAVSLNCLLCIVQFTGANPLRLYPAGMNYYDGNVLYSGEFLGTIGNADILSALLSLSIPAFFAAIMKLKDKRRFLLLIPLALCLFVLFKSFVAGGIVGVAGAVILSIPVLPEGKTARKRALIIVAAVIVLILAVVYFFGGRAGGFIYEASETMHGRVEDSFGSQRIFIWRNAASLVTQRPLFGGGADTLGYFTDAVFSRYDENLGFTVQTAIDAAHNEYLNILVNQGALALACYLAVLVLTAVKWVKGAPKSPAAAICGCGALGYCIQAFFGVSSPIVAPFLWIALAIIIADKK